MIKTIPIPWAAWYSEPEQMNLDFPDKWKIQTFTIQGAPPVKTEEIQRTLRQPIGTKKLWELAQGKKDAVIVVEDISRPSKLDIICLTLLEDLNAAGIPDDCITILGALGAHRPMTRFDYMKKLGPIVCDRVNIENHHPYENLVHLGVSKAGTPIAVNKTYYEADVKVAVGTVAPHPLAGFGGGAKLILPGISGIETLDGNHQAAVKGVGIGLGFITELRLDIEDVCQQVGLDFSVNLVTSENREITGVFAGHFIQAHRTAVDFANQVYHIPLPRLKTKEKFDIGFFNLYPEDTEFSQAIKGINLLASSLGIFKRTAPVVFMTASPEGRGFHSLTGETGAGLYENWGGKTYYQVFFGKRPLTIFSPNIARADINHYFPAETQYFRDFGKLTQQLNQYTGPDPKVALFTTSLGLAS